MSKPDFSWKEEVAAQRARAGAGPGLLPADTARRLAESDAELLAAHPPDTVAREVRRRQAAGRTGRRLGGVLAVALPAAAALVLVTRAPRHPVQPSGGLEPGVESAEELRTKGSTAATRCARCGQSAPHLHLYSLEEGKPRALEAPASVHAGEHVQVGYFSGGEHSGVIVSVDGAGGVTLHWPRSAQQPPTLPAGGEAVLPLAFELDEAPGFERFFLVTGEGVTVAGVQAAAARLAARADARTAPLELPAGLSQASFLLDKQAPAGRP